MDSGGRSDLEAGERKQHTMTRVIDDTIYEQYLTSLLAGKREACSMIVTELLAAGIGPKDLYVHLFQRAQYRVGELWEQQNISVAVEHLSTAITQRMLTLVQGQVLKGPERNRTIIIACVADEYHQLGGRMIADFCELRGWRGYFQGANTPLADLLRLIEVHVPDLLGLSLSIYFNLPELVRALDAVTEKHPELPILVGGQAFRWGAETAIKSYPTVSYISSLDELEQRMAEYEH